jgi:hypothetical protein
MALARSQRRCARVRYGSVPTPARTRPRRQVLSAEGRIIRLHCPRPAGAPPSHPVSRDEAAGGSLLMSISITDRSLPRDLARPPPTMYRLEFELVIYTMESVVFATRAVERSSAAGPGGFSRRRNHLPGIFSGMISHPSPEAVVSELGDKVIDAIVRAVAVAKNEFELYRQQHPSWAAENAARTIADMIHDWMWTELKQQLDLVPHVNMVDKDPRREIAVQVHSPDRLSYLMRIKLHHLDGRTSSYQTQTVIDFELQGRNETFPGWGEVRLEAGYEWDKHARIMGWAEQDRLGS